MNSINYIIKINDSFFYETLDDKAQYVRTYFAYKTFVNWSYIHFLYWNSIRKLQVCKKYIVTILTLTIRGYVYVPSSPDCHLFVEVLFEILFKVATYLSLYH